MVEEKPTLYVSAARPVIVYLPSAEVDADPKPTLVPSASTNTPPKALPDAFVTLPVMVAPGIIVASTPVLVAAAVTLIGVAVVWDGCPLYHWVSKLLEFPHPVKNSTSYVPAGKPSAVYEPPVTVEAKLLPTVGLTATTKTQIPDRPWSARFVTFPDTLPVGAAEIAGRRRPGRARVPHGSMPSGSLGAARRHRHRPGGRRRRLSRGRARLRSCSGTSSFRGEPTRRMK